MIISKILNMRKAWYRIPEVRSNTGQMTNFYILLAIKEGKCKKMTQYAERLSVSTAAITGIVDSMERVGLVKRLVQSDRRIISLALTERGEAVVEQLTNELI